MCFMARSITFLAAVPERHHKQALWEPRDVYGCTQKLQRLPQEPYDA